MGRSRNRINIFKKAINNRRHGRKVKSIISRTNRESDLQPEIKFNESHLLRLPVTLSIDSSSNTRFITGISFG